MRDASAQCVFALLTLFFMCAHAGLTHLVCMIGGQIYSE